MSTDQDHKECLQSAREAHGPGGGGEQASYWRCRAAKTKARCDALERALDFYAQEESWTQLASWGGRIHDDESAAIQDGGQRARDALSGLHHPKGCGGASDE